MKKQFFYSMLAAAMLAGCSSEKVTENGPSNETAGDGFIALNLNLPTVTNTTRADDDPGVMYNDGLPSEYQVKNATLVIFSSNDESTATVTSVIPNVITTPWNDNSDPNVTTSSKKVVVKVSGAVVNSGVLAVLNNNEEDLSTLLTGKTFKQVLEVTNTKTSWATAGGILMTNAPLSSETGTASYSGNKVKTLATISKIYKTEAEAGAGTADEIYVERAVGKVTMQKAITTSTLTVKDVNDVNINAEIVGWTLDNTNTKSYLVRNTINDPDMNAWGKLTSPGLGSASYRFLGTTAITTGSPANKYRTYWAKDPNYSTDATTDFSTSASPTYVATFGDENPQYCFENTFDVAHQVHNQTTRVVLKIQLNGGTDLFIMNDDHANIYKKADIDKAVKSYIINNNAVTISSNLNSGETVTDADFDITYTEVSSGEIIAADGKVEVASWAIKSSSESKFKDATAISTVNAIAAANKTAINGALNIVGYNDGISYYQVRIKHFGDDLTPWNTWEDGSTGKEKPTAGTTANIYPGTNSDAKYLGRYGVLRNNWYDIKVNKINTIGSVTTPSLTGNPDDEIEQYIAVKINILSWAKRTQSVIL